MNTRPLKSRLLASTVIAGMALSASNSLVNAQEQDEEIDEARQATVQVTGSRIYKRDYYSNSPIETISSETIEVTGTINVEELINIMPQAIPGFGRTSNNPGIGAATIDLRGLGSSRTLVLVDGRRFTPSGVVTVDLNNIPPSMIESVEIITGGASAVYGADAVSGVVNFILKDDYEGLEFRSGYEATFAYGDAEYYDIGFTFGANLDDGRGNVIFDVGHTDRKPVFQGDRTFSQVALGDSGGRIVEFGSSGVPAGHSFNSFDFTDLGTSTLTGAGTDSAACSQLGTVVRSPSDYNVAKFGDQPFCAGQAIFAGGDGFRPWINGGPNNDRFNYAPFNYLMLPQERFYSTAKAKYNVNDQSEVYGQLTVAFNQVPSELAPTPAFTSVTTSVDNPFLSPLAQRAFRQRDALEAQNTYRSDWNKVYGDALKAFKEDDANDDHDINLNPAVAANAARIKAAEIAFIRAFVADPNNGVPNQNDAKYQPDGSITTFVGRRMVENGTRQNYDDQFVFQITSGLKGMLGTNLRYDTYFQIGRFQNNNDLAGDVSLARYLKGVNSKDDGHGAAVCVDASGGCVPIDIWGAGDISAAAVEYSTLTMNTKAEANLRIFVANVAGDTSGVLELQGGPIGWAAGIEYREQSYDFRPDDSLRRGNVLGFNSARPLSGGFDVYELYVETDIPISRDRPWAHLIELNVAGRFSDYSSVGGVENFKFGGTWSPVEDVRFRLLYNTAVRAPNISELYSEQSNGFPSAIDPCSSTQIKEYNKPDNEYHSRRADIIDLCKRVGIPNVGPTGYEQRNDQIEGLFGGNPDLKSEEAGTLTFGVVWRPQNLDGLDMSVDFYQVEIKEYITSLAGGVGGILSQCHLNNLSYNPNTVFCRAINRGSLGEPVVTAKSANAATLNVSGFDLSVDYAFEIDTLPGSFSIDYVATFLDTYEFKAFDDSPYSNSVGSFTRGGGGEPRPEYKHNFTMNYAQGGFSLHLDWFYITGVDDTNENAVIPSLDAYNFFTASATWNVNENLRLIGGIKNLFDIDPPILGSNQEQSNTHPATYDPFGRVFYVRTKFSF